MKYIFLKKIIIGITLFMIVLACAGGVGVQKAKAQWEVFDPANFTVNTITSINTTQVAFNTFASQFQNGVLNTIATALVKQLIRQITADVVNWINSGFEGSPAFVQNPGGFLIDVADQATGEFLAANGGPLTFLCSPFSIDIRLALAFKYHPKTQQRYSCTLSKIIDNSIAAGENATINGRSIGGFINGDFSQGGWPAFISLTTEPQNNPYGAYLTANSELGLRVANAQVQQRDEIKSAGGFLSYRDPKCKADVKAHNAEVQLAQADSSEEAYYKRVEGGTEDGHFYGEVGSIKSVADCPIKTPGSAIAGTLQEHLNGPLKELQLVDSINEVVNALAALLINTVLQGGLSAISGTSPSDSTSYINQVQAEANAGTPSQVASVRNDFLVSVGTYITTTLQYKVYKDQSLNLILEVKNGFENARACYVTKLNDVRYGDKSFLESRLRDIDTKVSTDVTPLATVLLTDARGADTRYTTLTGLRSQANNAQTLNDLNGPSQTFNNMIQNQNLITQRDVENARLELEANKTRVAPLKLEAQRSLQECQTYAPSGGGFH